MNKETLKSLNLCSGTQTFRKHLKCFNSKRAARWTESDWFTERKPAKSIVVPNCGISNNINQ